MPCPVTALSAARGAAERVEVRDLPHGGLASIAAPLPFAADGVPRGLMPPVVVAATEREVLLLPDDLAANREAGRFEIRRDRRRLERRMPDIRDRAREQLPRRRPFGAIVVHDATDGRALRGIHAMPPGRVVRRRRTADRSS